MSYCKESGNGKDIIIFVTKEDHNAPLKDTDNPLIEIPKPEEEGAIKDNGEINWACPCMSGMVSGPCGYEFREAFSCFHYSTADPKGSDCIEPFMKMQECFSKYPTVYPSGDDDKDSDEHESSGTSSTGGGLLDPSEHEDTYGHVHAPKR